MINLITLGLFILFLVGVGAYKSRKIQSESLYLLADRNAGFLSLTATLVMTEFNSATLISFSSLGYAAGKPAFLLPLIFLTGLLFYAITVARKWKSFDHPSVAHFFKLRYGTALGRCGSIFLMMAMTLFSATYIKSLTLLLSPLFSISNNWILSGFLTICTLLMTLRGGLISIIRTDLLSFFLVLIFFPLLAFLAWKSPTNELVSTENQILLSGRFLISLILLTMFTYILAPWYGQKMVAARNEKIALRATIAAALIIFLLYGSAILATFFLKQKGILCAHFDHALPQAIAHFIPKGFQGLAYGLLFATSATTLTGVWNALSAMWIHDFLKPNKAQGHQRSMWVTILFALLSYWLANSLVDRVFDKMILANIPIAALSFALLAGFYWEKASKIGAYCSVFVGLICGIGAYLLYGESGMYTWYWAAFGIPLIFLTGIVSSYFFPDRKTILNA